MIITQSIWHLKHQELHLQQNHVLFANHSSTSFLVSFPSPPSNGLSYLRRPRDISCLSIKGKAELAVLKITNKTNANSSEQGLGALCWLSSPRTEQEEEQPSEEHLKPKIKWQN